MRAIGAGKLRREGQAVGLDMLFEGGVGGGLGEEGDEGEEEHGGLSPQNAAVRSW